eukprot:6106756-Amphidinium_carterae.1
MSQAPYCRRCALGPPRLVLVQSHSAVRQELRPVMGRTTTPCHETEFGNRGSPRSTLFFLHRE